MYSIAQNSRIICEHEILTECIKLAENYFAQLAFEGQVPDEGEEDVILLSDNEKGEEVEEKIIINYCVEFDTYDGGRWDYRNGIGAV